MSEVCHGPILVESECHSAVFPSLKVPGYVILHEGQASRSDLNIEQRFNKHGLTLTDRISFNATAMWSKFSHRCRSRWINPPLIPNRSAIPGSKESS